MNFGDDFNRPDENPLSDGGKWAPFSYNDPLQLQGHRAMGSVEGIVNQFSIWTADVPGPDQWGQFTFQAYSNRSGLVLRSNVTGDGYLIAIVVGGTLMLYVMHSGVPLFGIGAGLGISASPGDVFRGEAKGDVITLYQNGSLLRTWTDGTFTSGLVGLFATTDGDIMSNFSGGDLGRPHGPFPVFRG